VQPLSFLRKNLGVFLLSERRWRETMFFKRRGLVLMIVLTIFSGTASRGEASIIPGPDPFADRVVKVSYGSSLILFWDLRKEQEPCGGLPMSSAWEMEDGLSWNLPTTISITEREKTSRFSKTPSW